MPAIKFDTQHRAEGWSFILEHANDAYFRKDRIVLVDPPIVDRLKKAGIPYEVVNLNGEKAVATKQTKRKSIRTKGRG